MLNIVEAPHVNGIDLGALGDVVDAIEKDSSQAKAGFAVTSRWAGQTRSESVVEGFTLGGQRIERSHNIVADEPFELLGTDSAPNPQELLMAAVNACMMVGYVAGAATMVIRLESVEIWTRGELDLRGFLGLSDDFSAGANILDAIPSQEDTDAQWNRVPGPYPAHLAERVAGPQECRDPPANP